MFVIYLTWSSEQRAMSRNRRDVRCGFLFGALEADVPNWSGEFLTSPIDKLIPNQSVLALTARTWALQNCKSLIPSCCLLAAKALRANPQLSQISEVAFICTRYRVFPPTFYTEPVLPGR
jgi:hypothetical protein